MNKHRRWSRLLALTLLGLSLVACDTVPSNPTPTAVALTVATPTASAANPTDTSAPINPTATTAAPATAAANTTVVMPTGLDKIQHFVFIMQENRSFDSYFGTYPGADGIPAGTCVPNPHGGICVKPFHDTNDVNRGGPHNWNNAQADIDSGKIGLSAAAAND